MIECTEEEEIVSYFSDFIPQKLEDGRYGSEEGFLDALKSYCDGCRFSGCSDQRVYNPVSIWK